MTVINPIGTTASGAQDPARHGADPTGATDATAAFQAAYALAADAGHYHLAPSPGTYTVAGTIHGGASGITTPLRLTADPGTVTIQRGVAGSPATTVNSRIIDIEGSVNASTLLSADAAIGDVTLTVATLPAGIVVGSTLEVTSNVILSGNAITAEYVEVDSITGAGPFTINLRGGLEEAYAVANAGACAVVNWAGVGTYIRGVIFRQTEQLRDSPTYPLVTLQRVREFQLDSVTCRDADVPGLDLRNAADGAVTDYYCENLTDQIPTYVGYGINLNNHCRNVTVTRPRGTQVRHVFTTNADAGFGCPRHFLVIGGKAWETHSGGWNTHREAKHGVFAFCEAHHDIGGFFIRAPYITLIEPQVFYPGYSAASPGTAIAFSSDQGTFTAGNSKVIGGRVLLGPKSLHGWFTDCPGPHQVDSLTVIGAGTSGTNFFGQTNASNIELTNCHSENPKGAQHFICFVGSGHVVNGGKWIGGGKPIASVAAPAGGVAALTIAGNPTYDATFNLEQNTRALVQLPAGAAFSATGNQTLRDLWHTVFANATTAGLTFTSPANSAAFKDKEWVIVKTDATANPITFASGGGSIIGTATTTTQGAAIHVRSDGTNWYCSIVG